MQMTSSLIVLIVVGKALVLQAQVAQGPRLLSEQFYKKSDVCADARIKASREKPAKKFALVLAKTHLCDVGTNVCVDSLRTLLDPANVFVRENFVTYHTRFLKYDFEHEKQVLKTSHFKGEAAIRAEWQKPDSDPEVMVVDLATCRVLGRNKLMNFNALLGSFISRYAGMRRAITSIPGVTQGLGSAVMTEDYVRSELGRVVKARQAAKETSLDDAFNFVSDQSSGMNTENVSSEYIRTSLADLDKEIRGMTGGTGKAYTACRHKHCARGLR